MLFPENSFKTHQIRTSHAGHREHSSLSQKKYLFFILLYRHYSHCKIDWKGSILLAMLKMVSLRKCYHRNSEAFTSRPGLFPCRNFLLCEKLKEHLLVALWGQCPQPGQGTGGIWRWGLLLVPHSSPGKLVILRIWRIPFPTRILADWPLYKHAQAFRKKSEVASLFS